MHHLNEHLITALWGVSILSLWGEKKTCSKGLSIYNSLVFTEARNGDEISSEIWSWSLPALKSWLIHHGIPSTVLRTEEMLSKALLTGRQDTERSNECNGQDQSSVFQVTLWNETQKMKLRQNGWHYSPQPTKIQTANRGKEKREMEAVSHFLICPWMSSTKDAYIVQKSRLLWQ